MDTNIPIKTALASLLPQNKQADDGSLVTEGQQIQTAGTGTVEATIGALLQDFFSSSNQLGGLGLRNPVNTGDVEAMLAEVSLILGRLAGDNDGLKGVASAVRKRNILGEVAGTYNSKESLRLAIEDKTAERSQITSERDALVSENETLQFQVDAIESVLPYYDDGDIKEFLEHQLVLMNEKIETNNIQIDDFNEQIDGLTGEIRHMKKSMFVLNIFGTFLGNFILRFLFQSDAIQIDQSQGIASDVSEEEKLSEILPAFEKVFDISLEDDAIREFIADENMAEDEMKEVLEKAIGLLGTFFSSLETLLQSADLGGFDLDTVALSNNKSDRYQLAL